MSGRRTPQALFDAGFEHRCVKAAHGLLLPLVSDLIRGCPFFKDEVTADVAAFVDALSAKLTPPDGSVGLLARLEAVIADPTRKSFAAAAADFEAAARSQADTVKELAAVRLHFSAAMAGAQSSINRIAAYAVEILYTGDDDGFAVREHAEAAVAWLMAMTNEAVVPSDWHRNSAQAFIDQACGGEGPGRSLVERMLRSRYGLISWRPGQRRPVKGGTRLPRASSVTIH